MVSSLKWVKIHKSSPTIKSEARWQVIIEGACPVGQDTAETTDVYSDANAMRWRPNSSTQSQQQFLKWFSIS